MILLPTRGRNTGATLLPPACVVGHSGALLWPVLIIYGAEEGGMWHVTSETLEGKLISGLCSSSAVQRKVACGM